MKKSILLLIAICFIGMVIYSCNKDENGTSANVDSSLKKELMGSFLPDAFNVQKNNVALIRLMPSAAQYTLDLALPNANEYKEILLEGIKNSEPVEVYLYEKTNEIAEVKRASSEVIKKFNSSKEKPSLTTKETLPIIPNEALLNSLFNSCATPTISYNYAGDGCYARAHKMRQIIINQGYDSAKQFIYGYLAAQSISGCCASWSYHVAPLVRFRDSNGQIQLRILDPSLFNHPVTQAEWFAACKRTSCLSGASSTSTKLTAGNVYFTNASGSVTTYDDNYTSTNCTISHYLNYSGCSAVPTPPCI